jgi:hypothetical protein
MASAAALAAGAAIAVGLLPWTALFAQIVAELLVSRGVGTASAVWQRRRGAGAREDSPDGSAGR